MAIDTFSAEALRDLILSRRSVYPKQYSGDDIPLDMVGKLIEAAHWAPNHGRTEPWFFQVFSGDARARLGKAQADIYQSETPPELFQQAKYDSLASRPTEAAHVIAICMKRGSNANIPEIEEIEAVACAVQNMWLMTTALGLGGYWSTGGFTYRDALREWLGLGPQDKCLGFFYLGVPTGIIPPGRRVVDWSEKVSWVSE
ncbi:MAG: nitroreductase [Bacteroidia bacterium]|nr:nitroreductase [Bacteroidia bacterium]